MSEIGVGLNRSTRHLDQRLRRGLPDAGNLIMAERPDELLAASQGRPVENINVCETPASAVRCSHAAARRPALSDQRTLYAAQIASVRRLPNRSTSAAAPRPLSFPEHRTSDGWGCTSPNRFPPFGWDRSGRKRRDHPVLRSARRTWPAAHRVTVHGSAATG